MASPKYVRDIVNPGIANEAYAAEGDTFRVNRGTIFVTASKREKIVGQTSNGSQTNTTKERIVHLVALQIPMFVCTYFDIPICTSAEVHRIDKLFKATTYTRKAHTVSRYDFSENKVVDFSRAESSSRTLLKSNSTIKKLAARLPLQIINKRTLRPFTVSICFPSWFNPIMVGQALAGMIVKHQPNYFVLNGKTYTLDESDNIGSLLPGSSSGAWALGTTALTTIKTEEDARAQFDGGYVKVYSSGGAMTKKDNKVPK